jgi:hypothetical protein
VGKLFAKASSDSGYRDQPGQGRPEYEIKVKNEVLRAFAADEESQN